MGKLAARRVRHSPIRRIAVTRGDIVLVTSDGKRLIWDEATARKPHTCVHCKEAIEKRDRLYRPVGSGRNRMDRLCMGCIDAAREDGYVAQRV